MCRRSRRPAAVKSLWVQSAAKADLDFIAGYQSRQYRGTAQAVALGRTMGATELTRELAAEALERLRELAPR